MYVCLTLFALYFFFLCSGPWLSKTQTWHLPIVPSSGRNLTPASICSPRMPYMAMCMHTHSLVRFVDLCCTHGLMRSKPRSNIIWCLRLFPRLCLQFGTLCLQFGTLCNRMNRALTAAMSTIVKNAIIGHLSVTTLYLYMSIIWSITSTHLWSHYKIRQPQGRDPRVERCLAVCALWKVASHSPTVWVYVILALQENPKQREKS